MILQDEGYEGWRIKVEADTVEELEELANKEYFFVPLDKLMAVERINLAVKIKVESNA